MSRRGENIYKRKDGRWEGRYVLSVFSNGKKKYGYVYDTTYRGVREKLVQAKARQAEKLGPNGDFNYGSVLDDWLRFKQPAVKASTYAQYYQLVEAHIRPELGACRLDELDTARLECFIKHLLSSGRLDGSGGLSPKSVNDILAVINNTLEYADKVGYFIHNIRGLTVNNPRKRIRVLSLDEQKRLKARLLTNQDLTSIGILLSMYTGIRIGELCALKWKDLDLNKGILRISATMQRVKNLSGGSKKTSIIVTAPKTAAAVRDIPLTKQLLLILKPLAMEPQAYILTGDPIKFIEPRTLENRFKKLLQECNIDDASFHSLRHTFSTRCIEKGCDMKSLSELLGHANVGITMNRYVHSSIELKRAAMEKLD